MRVQLPLLGDRGVPTALRGMPHRAATRAMHPWDWALPPKAVDLEIISAYPAGWDHLPRGERHPPLLFIHGVGSGAWSFAEHWLGAAVRRGYPAHALSLRGHGGSAGADRLNRTTMRDYLYDIMQAVITLPEPPVLIGHSMGALLVQEIITRYPARAAVLVAPVPTDGVLGTAWAQFRAAPGAISAALIAGRSPHRPEHMFCGLDERRGQAYLNRMGPESPLVLLQLGLPRRFGPVYCPVGVAGCREDALLRPADVRRTAEVFGVRPMWIPGAGHEVMLDSSHGVALDIILDWVDAATGIGAAEAESVPARR